MKVCIIGAGTSGLCAAKHAVQNGFEPVVYEQNDQIGGTWIYTDATGVDEFGVEIHTSMYQNLRTNLPKEIMVFPDFSLLDNERSYILAEEFLEYLNMYAKKFNLFNYIKLRHLILRVTPKNGKWQVLVKDLRNNNTFMEEFSYILICNGHYQNPNLPIIPGMKKFKGKQIHSHSFRCASDFKGLNVLIIGGGPSATDLMLKVSEFAKKTTLSKQLLNFEVPTFIHHKPDAIKFTDHHVIYSDETVDEIDAIIYCTGYKYSIPFLSADCQIYLEDNCVKPLYKQCINNKYPTMAFIGLLREVPIAPTVDIQTRFVMSFFSGKNTLPSTDEMMKITNSELKERLDKGWPKKRGHSLHIEWQKIYYDDLSEIAKIDNVAPVILKLYEEVSLKYSEDMMNFHENNFKILDDETFIKI